MEIKEKTVVSLTYSLSIDSGEIVDNASADAPFTFVHGIGATLPAFDSNLLGKKAGEEFRFSLSVQDGYGEFDASRMIEVPKEAFANAPDDFKLEVGKTLPMQDDQGNVMWATITQLGIDGSVKMDLNHPLAGQALHFAGTILTVRDATAEELEHGHVHGPGGHQH